MDAKQQPIAKPSLPARAEFEKAVREIWASGMLSNFGPFVRRLERRGGRAIGSAHAQAVASCDIGMVLAWRALDLRAGEVIVPSFTFCSTVNALRWNGLTPVFADIDPRTLCIDPDDVVRKISPRTVAVAAVHTFGCPAPIDALEGIAKSRGLKLLFDAAQGLGAKSRGRRLGEFGDASVFSLSGTKVVVAGEGGLATFRDPEAAWRFRQLRGYGFLGDYNCQDVGLNGKMSELNAALGWLSLGMLREGIRRRRRIARAYQSHLAGLQFQHAADGDRHAYKDFVVIFPSAAGRVAAEAALDRAGVQTKRYFLPVHRMDAYRDFRDVRLPVTNDLAERMLCLPMYSDLSLTRVEEISRIVMRACDAKEATHGLARSPAN